MRGKDIISGFGGLIGLIILGLMLFGVVPVEDEEFFENDNLEFWYPAEWTPVNFTAKNTSFSIQLYGNDTNIIFPVTIKTEVTKNNKYNLDDPEIFILRKLVGEKYPEIAKNCEEKMISKGYGRSSNHVDILKYKAHVDGKIEIRIFFLDGIHFCMIEGKTLKDSEDFDDDLESIASSLYAWA